MNVWHPTWARGGLFRPVWGNSPQGPELFSPLSLFSNGEQGAWYDPSDLSTLYQDAAGTSPVTADGDPVGLMLDKSGNDNHASQSSAYSRPIYRTDAALHWLEFDGKDDYLSVTNGADIISGQPYLFATLATQGEVPGVQVVFGASSSSSASIANLLSSADTIGTEGRRLSSEGYYKNRPDRLVNPSVTGHEIDWQNSVARVFDENVLVGENASFGTPGLSEVSNYTVRIGSQGHGSFSFAGKFFGGIVTVAQVSPSTREEVFSYLRRSYGH